MPKYEKTGRKRGRPRATEKIAETNHKVSSFFKKDTKNSGPKPSTAPAVPADDTEMIDTSSAPQ